MLYLATQHDFEKFWVGVIAQLITRGCRPDNEETYWNYCGSPLLKRSESPHI